MFKSKKLSVVVLAVFFFTIFTGLGTKSTLAAAYPNDIAGHWASAQISSLITRGITSGYPDGTYKPNDSISRAEFMTMINRAFNFNATTIINYTDVKTSDWYYNEIAKAKAAGYISGYPDGSIKPNQNIERQEAAAMLVAAAKKPGAYAPLTFVDASSIPSWSWAAISAVVQAGYMSGYPDGTFKPAASISRAEAVATIFNVLNKPIVPTVVKVTGVTLDESEVDLDDGDDITLEATINPSTATNKAVTWSSSKTSVATVSSTGKVTAKDEGTATITVRTVDGGFTDTCKVYVDGGGSSGDGDFELSDDEIDMDTYDEVTIKAYLPDDVDMDDVEDIRWDSDDDDIADITDYDDDHSSYIELTVESYDEEDDTTITIYIETDDETYSADLDVNVGDDSSNDDDDFYLDDDNIDMESDDETIVYVWVPDDFDIDNDLIDVTWDSDDDDIADISDWEVSGSRIALYVQSYDEEDDTTITITIETTDDDYDLDLDVNVDDDDSGDGDLTIEYNGDTIDEIDISLHTYKTITGVLEDADDIDDVDWEITDGDEDGLTIDHFSYDDDSFRYRITAEDDGDYEITFTVTTDDDEEYEVELDVTV